MAIPWGSTLNDPAVQNTLQGMGQMEPPAETPQSGRFMGPTSLDDPRVRQALEALGQMEAPDISGTSGSLPSAFIDPRVRQSLEALGQMEAPDISGTSGSLPSAFNDPRVRQALETLGQMEAPDISGTSGSLPSAFNDPRVRQALENMAQMEMPGGQQAKPFADGSPFNDSRVQNALQNMGEPLQAYAATTIKNALNGGELGPDMAARYDLPRYQLGCEKLLNMIPLPGGGLTKRPGLVHVGNAGEEGQNLTGRLIPWVYSSSKQAMLVLITNGASTTVYYAPRTGKMAPVSSGCQIPHAGNEIFELTCCQIGKYIYLAHPGHKPGRLCIEPVDGLFTFSLNITWEEPDFDNISLKTTGITSIDTEAIPPEGSKVELCYRVTVIDPDTGEESLPSPIGTAEWIPPQPSGYHWVINIEPVSGVKEYRVYKKRGGEFGFIGRIMAPETAFHDYNYDPDTADRPPEYQEFFRKEGDYPSLVFVHQQRLGFAATDNDPLTIWLSQSSNFKSFACKSPPTDDDGIEATLASTKGNRILWAISDRTGLAIGTEGDEWFLTGADGDSAISPNSLSFQPQTGYGSQPGLSPMRANSSLLFVQRSGRAIRDLGYSFQADRYEAQDLSLLVRHLFAHNKIVSWAWQEAPANILWCVLNSGRLVGLTYMPDQEIAAWHRHETAGDFLSVATLDDENQNSRAWFVVRRKIPQADGTVKTFHCIEILENIFEGLPGEWDKPGQTSPPVFLDGLAKSPYRARCIPCLPEAGLENGQTTLRVKKINAVKARVLNCAPFQCVVSGLYTNPTTPIPVHLHGADKTTAAQKGYVPGIRDWACPLGAGFRDMATLELIFDGPNPATILALAVTLDVSRETGGQI